MLNADDPLVRAMRSVSRARPWFYSPDPENPHLDEALEAGGRAITVVDGRIVILGRGQDPTVVMEVAEVPLTLAGASRVNVSNVLAATAAAMAIGVQLDEVAGRTGSFTAGAEHNAGRLNVYRLGTWAVLLDLAHNEASLASLLEVAGALRLSAGELAVVLGTAGDRTDEAIHAMGALAAQAADRIVVARRIKYQRGREPGEMEEIWRAGAAEAGVVQVDESADELSGLILLLDEAEPPLPDGSAVAVCALEQRAEMAAEIQRRGGAEMSPAEVAARGQRLNAGEPGGLRPGGSAGQNSAGERGHTSVWRRCAAAGRVPRRHDPRRPSTAADRAALRTAREGCGPVGAVIIQSRALR